jgi:hypothetical protein
MDDDSLDDDPWTDLPTERTWEIPEMPAPHDDRGWSSVAREAWQGWWEDPAASRLVGSPSSIGNVQEALWLLELHVRTVWRSDGGSALGPELRRWLASEGLTDAGKRYLRWRVPKPTEATILKFEQKPPPGSRD